VITTSTLIQRTLRIPLTPIESSSLSLPASPQLGAGAEMIRRLDSALLSVGFKLSGEVIRHFSDYSPEFVKNMAVHILAAVRELSGDHVQHNSYFIDFPTYVPDTVEFWVGLLRKAFVPRNADSVFATVEPTDAELRQVLRDRPVNLLALPGYGTYQHSFAKLVEAHAEFLPAMKDRVTVLHLGQDLHSELMRLFDLIAGTSTPPSASDRELLYDLVLQLGPHYEINFEMPGRETKATVNAALLHTIADVQGFEPSLRQIDTITDVLRAVDVLSGGDGTLLRTPPRPTQTAPVVRTMRDLFARTKGDVTPVTAPTVPRQSGRTRFVSLRRPQRRVIMRALQRLLADQPEKIVDVYRHQGAWKRLGEGIHPHEFDPATFVDACTLFSVARGEFHPSTPRALFERYLAKGHVYRAVRQLAKHAPGEFARNLDRLLRDPHAEPLVILDQFDEVIPHISGRVLLSLVEHFQNRLDTELPRVFVNRSGRIYVTPDTRDPLPANVVREAYLVAARHLRDRLDERFSGGADAEVDEQGNRVRRTVVLDPAMASVALPLSNRSTPAGLNVLPRGSVIGIDQPVLRFFTYWRQRADVTDFDLSVQYFDAEFNSLGHVSWTRYTDDRGATTYSGDIIEAQDGATEFIDVRLPELAPEVHYIVPQVFIFAGENFTDVAESFFGFMTMEEGQQGMPFEARAVHTKSDMRGQGRVATPLVFERTEDLDGWQAKWVHLYTRGFVTGGRVEEARGISGLFAQAMIRRQHLTVAYLIWLLEGYVVVGHNTKNERGLVDLNPNRPVTYIGMQAPEGLPAGSRVITPANLTDILPA
jgi:stress response protein SCP2